VITGVSTCADVITVQDAAFKGFLDRVQTPILSALDICAEAIHPVLLLQW